MQADTRSIVIYDAHSAFGLVDELEFLMRRAIEANPFFAPRFVVPAMPRLEDKAVRLIVARDEGEGRSRLRFFMPFSVETTSRWMRRRVVRAWTHPFGRLGTLPLDADDPHATAESLFDALGDPFNRLPSVLVLPDLRLGGALAHVIETVAHERGLQVAVTDRTERASFTAFGDATTALRRLMGAKAHSDHMRRLRRLGERGTVEFVAACDVEGVRAGMEDFLYLEASGWKGRAQSALLADRHRSAFAREAVNGLAGQGRARTYTLRLDGEPVGSLVVLLCEGEAVAWKTAFDERYASQRPGALVAALATEAMIADPEIRSLDSCAVSDHGVANRLWPDRLTIGTLVVALRPDANSLVARVAEDLEQQRQRLRNRWKRRSRLQEWTSFFRTR